MESKKRESSRRMSKHSFALLQVRGKKMMASLSNLSLSSHLQFDQRRGRICLIEARKASSFRWLTCSSLGFGPFR